MKHSQPRAQKDSCQANRPTCHKLYSLLCHEVHPALHHIHLVCLHVGHTIHHQATDAVSALIDSHLHEDTQPTGVTVSQLLHRWAHQTPPSQNIKCPIRSAHSHTATCRKAQTQTIPATVQHSTGYTFYRPAWHRLNVLLPKTTHAIHPIARHEPGQPWNTAAVRLPALQSRNPKVQPVYECAAGHVSAVHTTQHVLGQVLCCCVGLTSWPILLSWSAAASPAGPLPMMDTRRPVRTCESTHRQTLLSVDSHCSHNVELPRHQGKRRTGRPHHPSSLI
jgi:hypothetical protein